MFTFKRLDRKLEKKVAQVEKRIKSAGTYQVYKRDF